MPNAARARSAAQELDADAEAGNFSFHAMPWGADKEVFVRPPGDPAAERPPHVFILGNLGESRDDDESHGALLYAAAHAGLRVRHVGDPQDSLCHPCPGGVVNHTAKDHDRLLCRRLPALNNLTCCDFHDSLGRVDDAEMVREMQSARYAAVLRKFEGFELPGIESIFCGARPIVWDIPTYRWYRGHALFLDAKLKGEASTDQLEGFLRTPPKPVGDAEMEILHEKFSWQRLSPRFFEVVEAALKADRPGQDRARRRAEKEAKLEAKRQADEKLRRAEMDKWLVNASDAERLAAHGDLADLEKLGLAKNTLK